MNFCGKLDLLEPILIPTQEQIDEMSVLASLKLPSRYDGSFWWYYVYATSEGYRQLVEAYNESIASAGVLPLIMDPDRPGPPAQQGSEAEHSHGAVIRRGIAEKRISTSFLKAWAV